MFVAIACELASDEHREEVLALLTQYGFKQVHETLFESVSIKAELLSRLKRDLDRRTDYYDKVRMYQYPLDDVLVVTSLEGNHWRKTVMRQ